MLGSSCYRYCWCCGVCTVLYCARPDLVEVVQYRHAGLVPPALALLPVVRLAGAESPRPAPATVGTAGRGSHPQPGGGPVPAVLYGGLQVGPLTASKVTLPSSGPDIVQIMVSQHILHPVILCPGADADGVHAEVPAVVPGLLPGPLPVPADGQPGEVVGLAEPFSVNNSSNISKYQTRVRPVPAPSYYFDRRKRWEV